MSDPTKKMDNTIEIKQIKRLKLILRSLRDIGRLLVTENDRQQLINGICKILVDTRGYYNVWIGLIDEKQNVEMIAQAGFNTQFGPLHRQLEKKEFTLCIRNTLESDEIFSVAAPVKECGNCLLAKKYSGRGAMAVRLAHKNKYYGFMVLSIPQELRRDETEKNIVKEIATDIAYGLYRIQLEKKKKAAQLEIEESKTRFQTMIENSLNYISILQNHKTVYENTGSNKRNRFIAKIFVPPLFLSIHENDRDNLKKDYLGLFEQKIDFLNQDFRYLPGNNASDDTHIRWARISARRIDYLGQESIITNIMDITDSKEMEGYLKIQDKMASLGRVTAGIAHEIRNPLSGIYIYLNALKKIYHNMGDINQVTTIIDKVELASKKIESIIKRVMDFSKPNQPRFVMTNINNTIDEITKLTAVTLRKSGIQFTKKLDPSIPDCWNEPHLIEQVVLNLITNAAEAMKDYDGEKSIQLKTYKKGRSVIISIKDSGPGVPIASQSKIFDPFFTTKANSSGIGLSICHRIITDHGGALRLISDTASGAEFIIELPIESIKGEA
jgi:signal transduction histidine kinase